MTKTGLLGEEDEMSISDMVKKDQEMRQQKKFDVNTDLSNQTQLKKMIGEDPQTFLENLTDPKEIEGVWLIAQHADNDIELQNMILNLLKDNEEMITKKFNLPEKQVEYGVAMLTDRIMVNSSTGVERYRGNKQPNFSEVTSGIQKYGTQGGIHNGTWLPRPIEMNGEVYFFNSPEELYEDQDFLNTINQIRSSVGLPPLEQYVQNMQSLKTVKMQFAC